MKISIILLFTLTSCASRLTIKGYDTMMKTWLKKPIQKLVDKKGYPTEQINAPNGNIVYIYKTKRTTRNPSYSTIQKHDYGYGMVNYTTNTYGGGITNLWCDSYYEVDKNKNIVNYYFKGNNCLALDPTKKKKWY